MVRRWVACPRHIPNCTPYNTDVKVKRRGGADEVARVVTADLLPVSDDCFPLYFVLQGTDTFSDNFSSVQVGWVGLKFDTFSSRMKSSYQE